MHEPAADARDPVELLLDQYLGAARRGESMDVDALVARAGDRGAELRELIDSAAMLEGLKGTKPRVTFRPPAELGDYRIVGEIGRGGMGVVYEAEQVTLGRRVALKVLPPHALQSGTRLERFRREAQTAARLHHTNIVPIFGVGEQEGLHFYVMQLIVGRPLDEVIRALRGEAKPDRPGSRAGASSAALSAASVAEAIKRGAFAPLPEPSASAPAGDAAYYRSVVRIGEQVADALVYAHAQGTLHRDIKPANLILDGDGVVWVTDFGLAKVIEDAGVTNSSDLVGTLQYMAPEQLAGIADARTDVHGLGLVLYELAGLRPAFVADSRGELYERVRNEEPPPLAKVRPGVPRDLETIVRRALAKDPRHRYQTAAELADDLRRFLEDRPIKARPVSALEQVWRWGRRNRMLAGLGAAAVLGLVTATVVSVWASVTTAAALHKETLASQRAGENLVLALKAFDDLFTRIVGADLLRPDEELEGEIVAPDVVRNVSEDDASLLAGMLHFYDEFARANVDDAAARQITARAYHRVGEIRRQLGKPQDAIGAYRRALQLYEPLAAAGAVAPGVVAQVLNDLGRALHQSRGGLLRFRERPTPQQADEAQKRMRELTEEALACFERALATAADESRLSRYERLRAHDNLGVLRTPFGRGRGPGTREVDAAAQHHRTALALGRALVAEEPTNATYLRAVAWSCRRLASILGATDEATDLRTRAIEIMDALVTAHPTTPHFRFELMEALMWDVRFRRRENTAAPADRLARLQRAAAIGEELVAGYPTVPGYQANLALAQERVAEGLLTVDPGAAVRAHVRAVAVGGGLEGEAGDVRRAVSMFESIHFYARIEFGRLDATTRGAALAEIDELVERLPRTLGGAAPSGRGPGERTVETLRELRANLERAGETARAQRVARLIPR